jgi:hypothetical protein
MQINLPGLAIQPTSRIVPSIRHWTVGQLLDASVIGRTGPENVSLTIGGTKLLASTSLALNPGDKLQLRVSQLHPVAVLTPLRSEEIEHAEQIRQALAKTLPKQRSIGDSLKALNRLTMDSSSSMTHAKPQRSNHSTSVSHLASERKLLAVTDAARHVLSLVPSPAALRDPNQLRLFIARTGLFSEIAARNSLSGDSPEIPELDLKWQLRRLHRDILNLLALTVARPSAGSELQKTPVNSQMAQNAAKPAAHNNHLLHAASETEPSNLSDPGPLKKLATLIDSAIAKIETNQLSVLNSRLAGEHSLAVDLPVALDRSFHVVQLKINQQDPQSDGEVFATTTIAIEVPLKNGQAMRALVSHHNDRISIRMWSENPQLLGAVIENVGELSANLTRKGLENIAISFNEIRPMDQLAHRPKILVDERA